MKCSHDDKKGSVFVSYQQAFRFQAIFMPTSCERGGLSVMILFRFQIIPASCGEASSPKRLNFPPPPPQKKKFFLKKIKIYFKYWTYLTTILRNQWRLLMSRNAISANPEHCLFKIFSGSMPSDPLEGLKQIFCRRCAARKFFLGSTPSPPPPSPKQKI